MTAECPECGAAPIAVEEEATVENTVERFGDGTVEVAHKEWFGHGAYRFVCPRMHSWPVPSDIEVVWL